MWKVIDASSGNDDHWYMMDFHGQVLWNKRSVGGSLYVKKERFCVKIVYHALLRITHDKYMALYMIKQQLRRFATLRGVLYRDAWNTGPSEEGYLERSNCILACAKVSLASSLLSLIVPSRLLAFSKLVPYFTAPLVCCVLRPPSPTRCKRL